MAMSISPRMFSSMRLSFPSRGTQKCNLHILQLSTITHSLYLNHPPPLSAPLLPCKSLSYLFLAFYTTSANTPPGYSLAPHNPIPSPSHSSATSPFPSPRTPHSSSSSISPSSSTSSYFPSSDSSPLSFPSNPVPHPLLTRSKVPSLNPIPSPQALLTHSELATISEALASPQWLEAMIEEFLALQRNGTWSLLPLPPDRQPIGCKWFSE